MSNLSMFMKGNKIKRENVKYAPTKSLLDENGKPLEFEIRPLTTNENDSIKEQYIKQVPIPGGKPGMYMPKLDTKGYTLALLVKSVVFPDLMNAELQDSYGVTVEEALLSEMLDVPGEYDDFVAFVQKLNGFEVTISEKVDEAKN